ncbi:PaaI family thioesterase [Pacificoceanicola onchidii]|uniref:PaaI family thioesterase n=1 Tax=Pacificoceanicola onchidii TaxID=2562685 RepID=UPI0010A65454|nr:PaaI family thioesterase [Pacificoceanicola onchidii]
MDRVYNSFARQGMMTTLGARILSVEPGTVTISVPITPDVSQQQGFAHAALAFAIGDSAAGYSALSVMPEDTEVVTSEIKIHLLSPAIGESLIARGRVVKPGRRLVVVTSEVFAVRNGTEKQIALLTGTMVPVPV